MLITLLLIIVIWFFNDEDNIKYKYIEIDKKDFEHRYYLNQGDLSDNIVKFEGSIDFIVKDSCQIFKDLHNKKYDTNLVCTKK